MSFGSNHYLPVLKMKPGEKRALPLLTPEVRARMTPLFEVVERKPKPAKKGETPKIATVSQHLANAFNGLDSAVAGFGRYFLDCREISGDGPSAAAEAFARAAALGTPFTPVTGFSRGADVAAALAHAQGGIAIRLSREDFESGKIPKHLPAFMKLHDLAPSDVDLIVDLGAVDTMILVGVVGLAQGFLADVPNPKQWRALSVSACAFPSSMGGVARNNHATVPRMEWLMWRDELHALRAHLPRLPAFSDCGIQHCDGVEDFNPLTMQASAAIRYALTDDWLLIKGESTKVTGGTAQFPQLASLLSSGPHASAFAGGGHCAGCAGALQAAGGAPKFGSPTKWRQLGTIHHITRAVECLAALTWP